MMMQSIPVAEAGPKVNLQVQDGQGQRELRVAALRPLYEAAVKARGELKAAISGDRCGNLDHALLHDAIHDLNLAIALAEGKSDGKGA